MMLYFDAIFFIVWAIASIVTIIRRGQGTVSSFSLEVIYKQRQVFHSLAQILDIFFRCRILGRKAEEGSKTGF